MPKPRDSRLWLAASHGETERTSLHPSEAPPLSGASPVVPSLDDTELLEAMRRRDVTAAKSFPHDRVRGQVERTVGRLLGRGDPDDDDLVQLALIEVVMTIERFRGDCSLDTWTSMVTARVVYKRIRKKRGERRLFAGVELDEALATASTRVERDVMFRGLVSRLREHLAAMDQDKAWTFVLHDVCGYNLREIAEITGVSMSAAQTRLTRGRRELHDRIDVDRELVGWLEDNVGDS